MSNLHTLPPALHPLWSAEQISPEFFLQRKDFLANHGNEDDPLHQYRLMTNDLEYAIAAREPSMAAETLEVIGSLKRSRGYNLACRPFAAARIVLAQKAMFISRAGTVPPSRVVTERAYSSLAGLMRETCQAHLPQQHEEAVLGRLVFLGALMRNQSDGRPVYPALPREETADRYSPEGHHAYRLIWHMREKRPLRAVRAEHQPADPSILTVPFSSVVADAFRRGDKDPAVALGGGTVDMSRVTTVRLHRLSGYMIAETEGRTMPGGKDTLDCLGDALAHTRG